MPISAFTSALIAALVGFGGTIAVVVQALQRSGGTPLQVISGVTALCLGIAIAGAWLSWRLRMPVVLAWSMAGAALLAAGAPLSWPQALAAYAFSGLLCLLLGLVPALGRAAARIPSSVASGMLAGVLLPFVLELFRAIGGDWLLGGALLLVFVLARQRIPQYGLLLALAVGVAIVLVRGDAPLSAEQGVFGALSAAMPAWDWRVLLSTGLPLFLVTLVSQNLPGLVILRAAGYAPPPRPLLATVGLSSVLLAPFGAYAINMSSITASICTGPDAHPDAGRRWHVGLLYAGCYLLLALFAAPLVSLFIHMPRTAIAAIAGVALLGPLTGALTGMLAVPEDREAAVLTFAATASGLTVAGIGSAFWGLVVGFLVLGAKRWLGRRPA